MEETNFGFDDAPTTTIHTGFDGVDDQITNDDIDLDEWQFIDLSSEANEDGGLFNGEYSYCATFTGEFLSDDDMSEVYEWSISVQPEDTESESEPEPGDPDFDPIEYTAGPDREKRYDV